MTRSVLSEYLRLFCYERREAENELKWEQRKTNINAIYDLKQYYGIQKFNMSDSKEVFDIWSCIILLKQIWIISASWCVEPSHLVDLYAFPTDQYPNFT